MFNDKKQKALECFFNQDLEVLKEINLKINKMINEKQEKPDKNIEIDLIKKNLEIVKIKIMATEKYILDQLNHGRKFIKNKMF